MAAAMKKIADAADPLYKTLDDSQKRRLAVLTHMDRRFGGGRGGVLNSTLFYTLHMYIQGWAYHEMGYASAMAWVLLLIIGVLTVIVFRSSNWWVSYGVGE